jgi:hypothetical protein
VKVNNRVMRSSPEYPRRLVFSLHHFHRKRLKPNPPLHLTHRLLRAFQRTLMNPFPCHTQHLSIQGACIGVLSGTVHPLIQVNFMISMSPAAARKYPSLAGCLLDSVAADRAFGVGWESVVTWYAELVNSDLGPVGYELGGRVVWNVLDCLRRSFVGVVVGLASCSKS